VAYVVEEEIVFGVVGKRKRIKVLISDPPQSDNQSYMMSNNALTYLS
jgi:hypothetical protein